MRLKAGTVVLGKKHWLLHLSALEAAIEWARGKTTLNLQERRTALLIEV
jgi:hypothetical protein